MGRSKVPASVIVPGGMMFADIIKALIEEACAIGATDVDIRRLAQPEGRRIIQLMVKCIPQGISEPRSAIVDYNPPINALIGYRSILISRTDRASLGLYDANVHSRTDKVWMDFYLVNRNRIETPDGICDHMYSNDLRPATLRELLCFARTHTDSMTGRCVVALGDFWNGLHANPVPIGMKISRMYDGNDLAMAYHGSMDFSPNTHFLAVPVGA